VPVFVEDLCGLLDAVSEASQSLVTGVRDVSFRPGATGNQRQYTNAQQAAAAAAAAAARNTQKMTTTSEVGENKKGAGWRATTDFTTADRRTHTHTQPGPASTEAAWKEGGSIGEGEGTGTGQASQIKRLDARLKDR